MERQPAPTHELAEELGAVLARLYSFLRRAILPTEMSLTQALALNTLRDLGPQRVTDLAQLEGVRQPTCTGLVNAMEAQGWVLRCVDQADKRVVFVELTDAGHAILESMSEARAAVLDRYLGALPQVDRDALAAALPGLSTLIERGTDAQGTSDINDVERDALAAALPGLSTLIERGTDARDAADTNNFERDHESVGEPWSRQLK